MAEDHLIDLDAEENEAEEKTPRPKKAASPLKVIDRRFWAPRDSDDEGRGGSVEPDVDAGANWHTEREALRHDLETRETNLREVTEAYLNLKDETERFRARTERESERRLASAKGDFLRDLLPVLDSFDRALGGLSAEQPGAAVCREGLEMIRGQFLKFLAAAGVERVDPAGEPFDPNTAEAVEAVPVEDEAKDNVVLETLSAGYRLGETLLRPASVRVGKKK
jgi:molecular chaperone GrpE